MNAPAPERSEALKGLREDVGAWVVTALVVGLGALAAAGARCARWWRAGQ